MIKGKIYQRDDSKDLTYANILSKITDFDIFMFSYDKKKSSGENYPLFLKLLLSHEFI